MNVEVYVGMTADLLHEGHINLLKAASQYGKVTVGLLTDDAVKSYKRKPVQSWKSRKTLLESLTLVDSVVEQSTLSYKENLMKYRPKYLIHGSDWVTGPQAKAYEEAVEVAKSLGCQVINVPYTRGISTTKLIQEAARIDPSMGKCSVIRDMLSCGIKILAMESASALTANIIKTTEANRAGQRYNALWCSSLSDSCLRMKPDSEIVTSSDRLHEVDEMIAASNLPVIYDADTAGNIVQAKHLARALVDHGVSMMIVEDKSGVKKNSLYGTSRAQVLTPIEEYVEKMKVILEETKSSGMVVISRMETLIAGGSVDEALVRSSACVEAGVDGIMIHSKDKDPKDIKEFCIKFKKLYPNKFLILVPTTYNNIHVNVMYDDWGADVIIHANHMIRASAYAMRHVANMILQSGMSSVVDDDILPIKQILSMIE